MSSGAKQLRSTSGRIKRINHKNLHVARAFCFAFQCMILFNFVFGCLDNSCIEIVRLFSCTKKCTKIKQEKKNAWNPQILGNKCWETKTTIDDGLVRCKIKYVLKRQVTEEIRSWLQTSGHLLQLKNDETCLLVTPLKLNYQMFFYISPEQRRSMRSLAMKKSVCACVLQISHNVQIYSFTCHMGVLFFNK